MKRQNSDAETLALHALAFIAADPDAMGGFLGQCGADVETVRARAEDPVFLGFVLDYLLTEDAAVLAFSNAHDIDPARVLEARAALPGGDTPDWT